MYLYLITVVFKLKHFCAFQLLGLHHGLQVCEETHVLAHVSGQHHVYHHLPDRHPLLVGEGGQYVTLL